MIGVVHKMSNGCPGRIVCPVVETSRSDTEKFSASCGECGARFGHMSLDKPASLSVALGVVLAGGTAEQFANACALADIKVLSKRTLTRHLEMIVGAIDRVYDSEFKTHREEIKNEGGRGTVRIPVKEHYLAQNEGRIAELIEAKALGIKVSVPVIDPCSLMSRCMYMYWRRHRSPQIRCCPQHAHLYFSSRRTGRCHQQRDVDGYRGRPVSVGEGIREAWLRG